MRLTSISTVGFKSEDIDYVLGDAAAFIGENETNKSQVLHAIDLVFSGHVDSDSIVTQGKTGDAVLTYARDEYKGITIEADDHDQEQRRMGIEAGFAWWEGADAIVFYLDLGISNGMDAAFRRAKPMNTPVSSWKTVETRWLGGEWSCGA